MSHEEFTVSVHERLDAPGYVVKLTVVEGDQKRVARFPCDGDGDTARAYNDAVLLRESIQGLAATGDVDALLPEQDEA